MTTDQPALTGTVSIESIEGLLKQIRKLDDMLRELANARAHLEHIATRSVLSTWSTLPSLVIFAGSYIDTAATTVAIIDQAELKIVGMVDAIRVFVTDFQHKDQTALDALTALESKADAALVPTPIPRRPTDNRPDIDPRLYQRAT